MRFICPLCGEPGYADWDQRISFTQSNKFKYLKVEKAGYFKKKYILYCVCQNSVHELLFKGQHRYEVILTKRQAIQYEQSQKELKRIKEAKEKEEYCKTHVGMVDENDYTSEW